MDTDVLDLCHCVTVFTSHSQSLAYSRRSVFVVGMNIRSPQSLSLGWAPLRSACQASCYFPPQGEVEGQRLHRAAGKEKEGDLR
jgi:hypothetical protein